MILKWNKKPKLATWPSYSREEINICKKILESGKVNYWTGEYCKLFEKNTLNIIKLNTVLL